MNRRTFFSTGLTTAAASASLLAQTPAAAPAQKGKIKQGVCRGVFGRGAQDIDQMCRQAAQMGFRCFDLMAEQHWPTLKKHGLTPTVVPGGGGTIEEALNRKENHDRIEKDMRAMIDKCAAAGVPSLITFSGNRKGMPDAEALDNCTLFLNKVKAQAEDKNVMICMEFLNSRVNHKDYQFDNMAFGTELMKRVNSPKVKILYDIYHVQIMEGDVIRRMKEGLPYIGHLHTAGNPGRHEFDDSQEMNYRGIAKAIAESGYSGFLSHEYSPLKDPMTSLAEAYRICDV